MRGVVEMVLETRWTIDGTEINRRKKDAHGKTQEERDETGARNATRWTRNRLRPAQPPRQAPRRSTRNELT